MAIAAMKTAMNPYPPINSVKAYVSKVAESATKPYLTSLASITPGSLKNKNEVSFPITIPAITPMSSL